MKLEDQINILGTQLLGMRQQLDAALIVVQSLAEQFVPKQEEETDTDAPPLPPIPFEETGGSIKPPVLMANRTRSVDNGTD